ncbi:MULTISPECIES: hypothetical protein [unclassified Coleofasciculus]|nr:MULTISPECIES: hypothetical protein [unclassified Coleofasciculus]
MVLFPLIFVFTGCAGYSQSADAKNEAIAAPLLPDAARQQIPL